MNYICILLLAIREILMVCISIVKERVEERVISCKVEIYRINFYLSPYKFDEICLYVNFVKWWNVKFQTK